MRILYIVTKFHSHIFLNTLASEMSGILLMDILLTLCTCIWNNTASFCYQESGFFTVMNTVGVCMFTAEEEKCYQSTAMCHYWYQCTVMLVPVLCLFLFSSCDEIKVKGKEENVKYIMCCLEFRVSIQFTLLLLPPQEVENPVLSSARSSLPSYRQKDVIDGRMM